MSSEVTLPIRENINSTPHRWKVIIASSFGGALEFFDFTAYNFFIIYFGQQFFPHSDDPNVGFLLAFATLGVSFFMRPLGGIVIGLYADHFGRKKALLLTIYLMTAGTLVLACAPTYATAGYLGTATLVVARLLQGFATGGEVGAASSILIENATAKRRGFYGSWTIAVQGLAVVFAGIIVVLLSTLLALTDNKDAMSEWGWRIPFFIGVAFGPVGCWLRLRLDNDSPPPATEIPLTAEPLEIAEEGTLSLLKQHFRTLICGILLVIGGTVSFYISSYYYSAFAVHYLGFNQIYSHMGILLGGIVTFIGSLYFGALSDRVGRKGLIIYGRLAIIILAYPSFWLLIRYPYPAMLFAIITVMVTLAMMSSIPAIVAISEMLPKRIRAVGFALVYSVGVAIFGGFAQFFATEAITLSGNLTAPSWYLIGCLLFSSIALFMFNDRYQDETLS